MSEPFTKLLSSITDSSIWDEDNETRIVWVTLLAMADKDGVVHAAVTGIAHRSRIPIASTERALGRFMAPDKYSRSPDYEGRRIERVEGGFSLLNHARIRENLTEPTAKEYHREQKRLQRAKAKDVQDNPGPSASASVSASASEATEALTTTDPVPDPPSFYWTDVAEIFSDAREQCGGGKFRAKRTDHDRLTVAAQWACDERPGDPAAACRESIENYLEEADEGLREKRLPIWGWANDPGAWLVKKPSKPSEPIPGYLSRKL